jgi:predicted NBD/HSP70 family sugar kinase
MNERTLLELIGRDGVMSRAQAARESGLSKPTVSLALNGLVEAGLVEEVGRRRGGKGPSAMLYRLNREAGWVVGIDVGKRYVRAAVADIAGSIVARRDEKNRSRTAASLVELIGSVAHQVAADAGLAWEQVTHATVGNPGVLDPDRGLLAHSPNLPGWGRQGLVEAIRAQLGTGVSFENDVNLAALGERAHGLGRGVENFVFLSVGTGIGAGIVIHGELYRGSGGAAGEIAYLPVGPGDPHDPRHRRRGLLEDTSSASGIVRHARDLGLRPATAKAVFAAARRGEEGPCAVVAAEAGRIALAIATLAPLLDPELVILGGGIGLNGDLLLEPIGRELTRISPFRPRIAVSELGGEVVLHGAVSTALEAAHEMVFRRAPDQRRSPIVI